jgi:hypothetical protein
MKTFLDIEAARAFIAEAIEHYIKTAPAWFIDWLDTDLYVRLGESWATITLDEMMTLQGLYVDGDWKPEPFAVNNVYKLFDRIGRDTSGIIGY